MRLPGERPGRKLETFSFFDELDLFVDDLPSEAVDSNMNPVSLFAFDDKCGEWACRICGTGWISSCLGHHIDHQIPDPRLSDIRQGPDRGFAKALNLTHGCPELGV